MNDNYLTDAELITFPPFLRAPSGQKIFFIHITKTGGTSIRKTLPFPKIRGNEKGFHKHYTYQGLTNLVRPELIADAFIFTIVRNPWDRLLSTYSYRKRKALSNGEINEQNIDTSIFRSFEYWASERRERGLFTNQNLQPQVDWLKDQNGIIKLGFIGRFEHLNSVYAHVCQHLSLTMPDLLHSNKSERPINYRDAYTPYLRNIIEHIFWEDIEYFKYQY